MDGQNTQQKNVYRYEPGELEKTRKNIGNIDKEEALKMSKILGGEIGLEKSAPVDEAMLKRVRTAIQTKDLRNVDRERRPRTQKEIAATHEAQSFVYNKSEQNNQSSVSTLKKDVLPILSSKERTKMDKLMMSTDFKIKHNYGLFNFIALLANNGSEKVMSSFVTVTLKAYLLRMQNMQARVNELVSLSPESYRNKINTSDDIRFRFLRIVGAWPVKETLEMYYDLEKYASSCTIPMMIPLIKKMYRMLLTIYFMNETKSVELLQNLRKDLAQYKDVSKEQMLGAIREISNEWIYLNSRVSRGLYPLLMRMCCTEYIEYQFFFTKQITKIFAFLNMTKFDVLLPVKKQVETVVIPDEFPKTEDQINKEKEQEELEKKELEMVKSGLKVLDRIFPGAGWLSLETMPDMCPFYQPLYNFPEGINLLSPENPLQITLILVKIIEDLLEGCRNIGFPEDIQKNERNLINTDSIMQIMNDWSAYRETVFDKLYAPYLKDYVNKLYSQKDFAHTQYGKRLISNMQWHTFYNYLPHLKFEQLLLEKPSNESKMRSLSTRTALLVSELKRITSAADVAIKNNTVLQEFPKIQERYSFDIPNIVSQRIDVLLGAKRKDGGKATNLNLLKYTLAATVVLHWWISNKNSPAYNNSDIPMCRMAEDGSPIFSVPDRTDQNALFIQSVKAAAAARASAAAAATAEKKD